MFLYGVIVPVIPFAMQSRSQVEEDRVQYWVSVLIAIYGAAVLAFSPVCGWVADRTSSRRSPLLVGLLALLGSTILLQIGNSTGILIAGRVLQGASAAVVWVVGMALLADTIPSERLAQAMGSVALAMSLGVLIAPLLGGVVFDNAGYDAVFNMAYGLIGLDIMLRLLLVEKKVAARWDSDAARVPAIVNDKLVNSRAEDVTQASDPEKAIPVPSAQTQVEVAGISLPRSHFRDRLPPVISLLYSRRLLSALFCSLIQAALLTSFDSVLTIHAATTFNWNATGAALLFLPLVIPSFLAPLFGWFSDNYGSRYPVVLGFLGVCPPFICLRFFDENSTKDKVLLCALLGVVGLFLTLTFPPIMAEISSVVEAKEKSMLVRGHTGFGPGGAYAQAYALFNVAYAGGCMAGPLLAGFIVEDNGWATMAWVLGLLSGFTALPAFLWTSGWVFD